MAVCPKCEAVSGDDWSQCEGRCPMPMSPHFEPETQGWREVSFASDVDEDDNCSICGQDYAECPCPGPAMDDDWEYEVFDGVLYARKVEVIE